MIKNLIMGALSALALYLTWITFKNGMTLSDRTSMDVDVMSYEKIMSTSEDLNKKLDQLDDLNNNQIVSARQKVKTEQDGFEAKKATYEKLEASASEAEIAEANKKQEYLLDYLWIVVGNYANDNNVRFKMETVPKEPKPDQVSKLDFHITGSYVNIINFIYDIQNDNNLRFKLDGIKIASSSSSDTTKASFTVSGITVKTSTATTN